MSNATLEAPQTNLVFDLDKFRLGHPARTRDGRVATFIAYVPCASPEDQLLVNIGDEVRHYWADGCVYESGASCGDLFLHGTDWQQPQPQPKRIELLILNAIGDMAKQNNDKMRQLKANDPDFDIQSGICSALHQVHGLVFEVIMENRM